MEVNAMRITLDNLPTGETAQVAEVDGENGSVARLMEMGLVAGSTVKVERTSPFGCPIAIRLKGTSIAIRRRDARSIFLIPLPQVA
jgi:ferrous iron transport protein A